MEDLSTDIALLKGVGPKTKQYLNDSNIITFRDLLENVPKNYNVYELRPFDMTKLDNQTVKCKVLSRIIMRKIRKSVDSLIFTIDIDGKKVKALAFGKGYLRYNLKVGQEIIIFGNYKPDLNEFIIKDVFFDDFYTHIEPLYKNKDIPDSTLSRFNKIIIDNDFELTDDMPLYLTEKYRLVDLKTYYKLAHFPNNTNDLKQISRRKKYEMYLNFCLSLNYLKYNNSYNKKEIKSFSNLKIEDFINELPYELTKGQKNAISSIFSDFNNDRVMNRLIQGDVGCGKTIVAIISAYANYLAGYQSVILAPTEILALQHYENFTNMLSKHRVTISLLTANVKSSEKQNICRALSNHTLDILVCTHSVFYQDVSFKKLGLMIVDEQHRFGVKHRSMLLNKYPHTDAMYLSATPIPRTLGLTSFGDMDITTIENKPLNRLEVKTKIVPFNKMDLIYESLKSIIVNKQQAFVICPTIEESSNLYSLKDAYDMISENISGIRLGIINGKMSKAVKDKVMLDFKNKVYDVLISTTVVEVGIDIKNATAIYVFNSERFGLSTLHQLRGRVGRNNVQSYCYLLTNNVDIERLRVLEETNDCFKIAEYDLNLRGPGDFIGENQSGYYNFDFKNDINIYNCANDDSKELLQSHLNGIKQYEIVRKVMNKIKDKNIKLN